jgi:membrane associated rhomboid family serine protease
MSFRSRDSVSERQPIFNVPGVVVAVLGAFLAVFLAADPTYGLLPDQTRGWLLALLAFFPGRLGEDAGMYPGGQVAGLTQFVTHALAHADFVHLAVNSAWFLAFGTPVARRLGAVRFLAFFALCGIGGALLFLLLNGAPMVGASGAISGLMAAAFRFLLVPISEGGTEALAGEMSQPPRLSVAETLSDRRILIAIAAWGILNVLAALAAPYLFEGWNIAWEAHLGGFLTGLLTFGLFDPGPSRSR